MDLSPVRVGTSGWSYKSWRGPFYPSAMAASHWLDFYQQRFSTVELNASFYRLPRESTVDKWRRQAADGFEFAVKGSRYITHIRRLRDCDESVRLFVRRMALLGPSLGPILWQLPPDLERDDALLRDFLAVLPREHRHVVEFRHPSWLAPAVTTLLDGYRVGTVAISSTRMPPLQPLSGGLLYLRLHGLTGGFRHDYTDAELLPWVRWVRSSVNAGAGAYVYFNNDGDARAPLNAARFVELIGEASAI